MTWRPGVSFRQPGGFQRITEGLSIESSASIDQFAKIQATSLLDLRTATASWALGVLGGFSCSSRLELD